MQLWAPTALEKALLSSVIAGREDYEVEAEQYILREDILELDPEERAHKGIFLSFQYPIEIPGVSVSNFIKTSLNESRKAKGLEPMPAGDLLKMMREKMELLEIKKGYLSRSLNQGFSGGEKKEMKSSKWLC